MKDSAMMVINLCSASKWRTEKYSSKEIFLSSPERI